MQSIEQALQAILQAVYGREVRSSIHDAIAQINDNANEAVDLAQIKFGSDVNAPTSSVGSYGEGTLYFNILTGIIWKLSGGAWVKQGGLKAINTIIKTDSRGLRDTYTIGFNDGTTQTYDV